MCLCLLSLWHFMSKPKKGTTDIPLYSTMLSAWMYSGHRVCLYFLSFIRLLIMHALCWISDQLGNWVTWKFTALEFFQYYFVVCYKSTVCIALATRKEVLMNSFRQPNNLNCFIQESDAILSGKNNRYQENKILT